MAETSPSPHQRLRDLLAEGEDGFAARRCQSLLQLVEAVQERAVRPRMLRQALGKMDDALLLVVLHRILLAAEGGKASARSLMTELALSPSVLNELTSVHVEALYSLAQTGGLDEVGRLLLQPHIDKKKLTQAFDDNEHLALPLGVRRQAARGTDRQQIDRLLHDRDHRVIQLLLDNPRLTERDVIAIAARRPTRPEVLKVIASHGKWSSRYRVRKALACNPYTPDGISLRLLPTLLIQDLRFLATSGALLPALREEALALIARRRH
jgi:hypothetical protein